MRYSGKSRGHQVAQVDQSGSVVRLEDDSTWSVYQGFAVAVADWSVGDLVTVKTGKDPEFPYLLVNVNRNTSAECCLIEDGIPEGQGFQ